MMNAETTNHWDQEIRRVTEEVIHRPGYPHGITATYRHDAEKGIRYAQLRTPRTVSSVAFLDAELALAHGDIDKLVEARVVGAIVGSIGLLESERMLTKTKADGFRGRMSVTQEVPVA